LHRALDNIGQQYHPRLITVATTCVAETIGEDVPRLISAYREKKPSSLLYVSASTPSFKDGHAEGFHSMVRALVDQLATKRGPHRKHVNILPPIVSPADLRHLRELATAYGVGATLLPDYADTLDGAIVDHYEPLPNGGTTIEEIAAMPTAAGTLDLTLPGKAPRVGAVLDERGSPSRVIGLPLGVRACDAFCGALADLSGTTMPAWIEHERGRLLDAYADGHKYIFGKRIAIFGEPEQVAAIALFLAEIGARPVVCATGARNRALTPALRSLPEGLAEAILEDTHFGAIEEACRSHKPDLIIGGSKGYRMARELGVPLLRIGFPIHDRIGAGRLLSVGYRGTLRLFDAIVNTFLENQQDQSAIGYSYL
jgi:nitrogenase molybdenum-iron protein NifN